MLADMGLPLSDSVEAFLVHRDPIISAVTQMIKKKEGFTGRVVEAIPLVYSRHGRSPGFAGGGTPAAI